MSFLYPFVFFLFAPLYFLYKHNETPTSRYKKREKLLLFLSLAFILLALARPVLLDTLNKQKFDSQDFIIAIDASFSMQADDLQPTRYEVAKGKLKEILTALPQNRFAIFAFTSNAILISPPTTDTAISLLALEALDPKFILTKGTSLKELLKTISKVSHEEKKLIIFSDGGEERDLEVLVDLAKKNKIIPFVVATGSKNGALLSQDDKKLKDEKNNLVISRINPILKDFAMLSKGAYYLLDSQNSNVASKIMADMRNDKDKSRKADISVLSYTQLYYFPLLLSIIFFLMAVTKIHQIYVFLPLLFFPNQADSSLLDFYHIEKANGEFEKASYARSAQEFEKATPSPWSYYNRGVSLYKAKNYKEAAEIFASVQTKDEKLKQKIFYNLGNCAVKIGKYERAKIYYRKALNLGEDADSHFNLTLLYRLDLKEKADVSNMFPKNEVEKKTDANKKENLKKDKEKQEKEKQEKSGSSSSKANQKAAQSSNGSSDSQGKKEKKALKKTDKTIDSKYKIGYKAYELINKGYTDEKRPW